VREKARHTPGPWEAEAAGRHRKEIYANGVGIATVWRSGTGNQIHATARLMAAAPEMLKALKWLWEVYQDTGWTDGRMEEYVEKTVEKAEGK